jgi:hypothetical protein
MHPIEWLNQHIPGFADLTPHEREAIEHFTLLWTLFEAKALNMHADGRELIDLAVRWHANNLLNIGSLADPLAYFRNRYFQNGAPTHHFDFLRLPQGYQLTLVSAVLSGNNQTPADCLAALFLVCYRLRNNLFHGEKWAYGLRDQRENFAQASNVLMRALEIHLADLQGNI